MRRTREWTCKLMEAMDEGIMDARAIADMCLSYMSEAAVEDMCRANDLKQALSGEDEETEQEDVE